MVEPLTPLIMHSYLTIMHGWDTDYFRFEVFTCQPNIAIANTKSFSWFIVVKFIHHVVEYRCIAIISIYYQRSAGQTRRLECNFLGISFW